MFKKVLEFENKLADFFGSQYGIATDCCTHAIELCLRYNEIKSVTCPTNTYISIPFTLKKLNIEWHFEDKKWADYYFLGNTNIIDAAVLWRKNCYIKNTFMCISFQYKKHLSLGRGGIILTDDVSAYYDLSKMRYDGRDLAVPWQDQNFTSIGYHYYMTPETAELGLKKFNQAANTLPKKWTNQDYPNLSKMEVFNNV